ncbi:neuronal acetylcholine receptor subunit non-alpha-2 [Patella vulgata]|uniref:neuronal acetylcholine receptor subunit non-alpha-2 n=1 Tax=Patella vulgata TaxID=6465 RepID=UPI0024A85AB4|nr:neuronal acetylcholine receptor subunit non-alpha-2 [Patella vulgata]
MTMYLVRLIKLDTLEQTLTTSGWMAITWINEKLTWNPEEYGGITHINVEQKDMWIPDFFAFNSIQAYKMFGSDDLRTVVSYTGHTTWEPSFHLTTSCLLDVVRFPVDYQSCSIQIESWTLTDTEMNVQGVKMITTCFETSSEEFEVIGSSVTQEADEVNGCQNETNTILKFSIRLCRKSTFYMLNVVGPIATISFLCGISLLVPPQSGEKLTVSITSLLSLTVYLSGIDHHLPKTSDKIAYFVIYVTLLIGMSFLGVVCNALSICIHSKSQRSEVPLAFKFLLARKYNNAKNSLKAHTEDTRSSAMSATSDSSSCCEICDAGTCNHWPDVARMFDKTLFLIFTIILFLINIGFTLACLI